MGGARSIEVAVSEDFLTVTLHCERVSTVPLSWYPRLLHATPEERMDWLLIDDGRGIHWEALDEDINVAGLLAGRPSGESEKSFARWLAGREQVKA